MAKATYKDAGVDLELYRQSMARLPPLLHRTFTPRVMPLDGGFAGLFQLDFANRLFARNYKEPVLVSCTDGVGTKLKVAQLVGRHDTVGIDLVAMSVNDALCCGAEPLFFLDYVAMSHDDPSLLAQIVQGVSDGCLQADCACSVARRPSCPICTPGAITIWPAFASAWSSGSVSSTARPSPPKIWSSAWPPAACIPTATAWRGKLLSILANSNRPISSMNWADRSETFCLLRRRIYAKAVRHILSHYTVKDVVHGIAHITGGGLLENLGRIIPENRRAIIRRGSWPVPAVFSWLQKLGEVDQAEMDQVFNLGLGMVLVVSSYYADSIQNQLSECGLESWPIGRIVEGPTGAAWE